MLHANIEAIQRTIDTFKSLDRILASPGPTVPAWTNHTAGHVADEDDLGLSSRNLLHGHGLVLEWWFELLLVNPLPVSADSPDLFRPRVTVELNRERAFLRDDGTLLARATYWGAEDGWHQRVHQPGEPPLDPILIVCPTARDERVNANEAEALALVERMRNAVLTGDARLFR